MTLITSDEDHELDGCVFANDKCYVRKNVTGVTLSYKLKKGYYVPYRDDDEYECQVSATISGSKTDDVTTRYDDFDDIITVSVDFPLDKDGNPVIGNVVISPVVRQYKKVTFSCNYKQIYYVDINGYGSADETEKTVLDFVFLFFSHINTSYYSAYSKEIISYFGKKIRKDVNNY